MLTDKHHVKRSPRIILTTLNYISILFGHFFLVFSLSLILFIFGLHDVLIGLTSESLIIETSIISIFLLGASYLINWTFPIYPEKALIIVFIWVLYSILTNSFCICCVNESSTGTTSVIELNHISSLSTTNEECKQIPWNYIYSTGWMIVLLFSYLVDITNEENRRLIVISIIALVITFLAFFFLVLIPISCNQLFKTPLLIIFIKITTYNLNFLFVSIVSLTNIEILKKTSTNKKEIKTKMKRYFLMDLTKIVWVLFVCDWFLFVVLIQYLLSFIVIYRNFDRLKEIYEKQFKVETPSIIEKTILMSQIQKQQQQQNQQHQLDDNERKKLIFLRNERNERNEKNK